MNLRFAPFLIVLIAVPARAETLPVNAADGPAVASPIQMAQAQKAAPPKAASTPRRKGKARRVLRVGPSRQFKLPSQAARVARNGDAIVIDAGKYTNCAVWRANGLLIRGLGGNAHITGPVCEDKALWVIKGNNVRVDNIEFSGANSSTNIGAGIRGEGDHLVVNNSYFHDNDQGILVGRRPKSHILIYKSRFERNGRCDPVCAHGIYIGKIAKLRVIGSKFHGQMVGHHIKSRALHTEIVGNRITDGGRGTASWSVNLPNGGTAVISRNMFQKGPKAENRRYVISIGEEGKHHPSRGIVLQNNVFENNNPKGVTFIRNTTKTPMSLKNNRFVGKGKETSGAIKGGL